MILYSEALDELVEIHYSRCSEHVGAILEVKLTSYTQNKHYPESCKDKWLARYRDTRAAHCSSPVISDKEPIDTVLN